MTTASLPDQIYPAHQHKEQRREEAERRLDAVLNNASVAIFMMDARQQCSYMNAAAERLTGYTLAETLGRALHDVIHHTRPDGSHYPLSECPIDRAFPEDHNVQGEEVFIRKDGTFVPVAFTASPIRDEASNTVGTIIEVRDVSAEKDAARALQAQTAHLQTLNETGAAIAAELELERIVQLVTDASVRLTGAQFGAFFYSVVDAAGESLTLYTLSGARREDFERFGHPRATAVFAPTFRGEGVVRSADITADPRYGNNAPHQGMPQNHLPVRSYLAVPVISRSGEVIGGLFFGHPEPGKFGEDTERLIVGIAGQAAVAIDNGRLYGIAQSELEERRHAEARLRELNDTLEQRVAERTAERDRMWRATRDLMCVAKLDGTLLSVNPAWERLLGWTEDELVGRAAAEIKHPDDNERTEAGLARLASGEPVDAFEDRYRHRDGSWRWISWSIEPAGELIYCAGRDVTAEKERSTELARVEAARREADALYRAYFENTAEALFVVNVLEGGGFSIEDLNPAHQSSIGLPLADVQGKRIDEVLPPELASRVVAHYERALADHGVYQYRDEFDLNGRTSYWDTVLVPVRDGTGRIVRLIGSSRDLTPQIAAEEQLRHSQKMEAMGQLTGGVAHDFNNLLTPIVGSLDMLMRRGLGSEREQRLIGGAMQSAERAKTLVQRLLAFARRQPLQASAVGLAQLVNGMAGLIGSTLGPKIEIRVELANDLPPARADANQLEMALLNLAVNARDAMPEGGTLTISAARESVRAGHRSKLAQGHYVRLSVADTGTGMDEVTIGRAIEPFFSTKGIGKGTGLGLSMVHGLAAQLGGGLTIESEIGHGTEVELWLPISTDPLDDPRPGEREAVVATARGRALLVDDEDLVRMSTADMLSDLGFEVVEASSAEEALSLIGDGTRPDLLVTDHLMPGMTGAELARKARLLIAGLPILIVSGYAEVEGIAPDLPRLTKPFRNSELAERLRELGVLKA
jgi:PAS domain S-box-containing protein